MSTNLDELIVLTANRFPADEENYPSLVGKTDKEKLVFNIRHQILHLTKRCGKFANVIEGYEHGRKELDITELKEQIPKGIIDILRIAQTLGMTGEEIAQAIEMKESDS